MRLAFGSDHAGFELRQHLESRAKAMGHEVVAFGAMSTESYDYPDAADGVCHELLAKRTDLGVVICGSGIGITIRANRFDGIRAANCTSVEMAELARQHNHANVLGLGQRLVGTLLAELIFDAFLATPPDDGERHVRRVHKLDAPPT